MVDILTEKIKKYFVYVYFDPRSGKPIYVGRGCGYRAYIHLKKSHNEFLNRKIAKIRKSGQLPLLNFVFYSDNYQECTAEEVRLIKLYGRLDLGTGTLVNFTDGGEGTRGRKITKTYRNKLSDRLQVFWNIPTNAAKMLAASQKPVSMMKRSYTMKLLWKDPTHRSKYLKAIKKSVRDPKHRAAQIKAMNDPLLKEKLSKATSAAWKVPSIRKKMITPMRIAVNQPGVKKARSNAAKIRMSDPARKKLQSNAIKAAWKDNVTGKRLRKAMSDPSRRKKISKKLKDSWRDPVVRKKRYKAAKAGWRKRKLNKNIHSK